MEQKNVWETYSTKQLKELEALNEAYRGFLSECKTERECVDYIVNMAEEAGYKELQDIIKKGGRLKKGDKVYSVWMNKSVALFHIGEKKMEEGMNILGAHIDSPRIDVKQNPLYENDEFAYLDRKKDKVGYEIPFTRLFYKFVPPTPSEDIFAEIKALEEEETTLMKELFGKEN